MTALIIFAHGSPIEAANDAVRLFAAQVAARGKYHAVVAAFLDGGTPRLGEAIAQLSSAAPSKIVVVPYFLTLGLHLQRDLPLLIEQARSAHPGIPIEVAGPLDGHPALVDIVLDRAAETVESPA